MNTVTCYMPELVNFA